MSRTINANLLTALTGDSVEPYYAVELLFDTRTITDVNGDSLDVGPIRLWTGYGDRTINVQGSDQVFTGTGAILAIAAAEEVSDLSAKSMTLSFTGLATDIISIALQEQYQRRKARVYLGEASRSEVVEIFSGRMDTMKIEDEGTSANVSLTIESKLVELERSRNWRYTHESHSSRLAESDTDSFFQFVADLQDKTITWGRKSN